MIRSEEARKRYVQKKAEDKTKKKGKNEPDDRKSSAKIVQK
jgi:hypothetical protein